MTALHPGPANDALELDSGLLLPLVAACVQQVDLEAGRILIARGLRRAPANLLPRPVLCSSTSSLSFHMRSPGSRSSVRLLPCSARSSSCACSTTATTRRSRNGQVDDEPYGGGAGMVLRVDVVAAALDAVYGGAPGHRVVALDPAGPPADPGRGRGARAGGAADAALGPLRGLRRARRDPPRLGRDLDRPVRALGRRAAGDGRCSTRSCGGCRARSAARSPASSRASRPSSTAVLSTLTTRARPSSEAGGCRMSCYRGTTGESTSGGRNRAD